MPKIIQDLTGKTFGIWKVLENKQKAACGAYLYKCLNIKFKDRKSKKLPQAEKENE